MSDEAKTGFVLGFLITGAFAWFSHAFPDIATIIAAVIILGCIFTAFFYTLMRLAE